MSGLAPMQLFQDIPVVPVERLCKNVPIGGPIWPNFPTQVAPRHCRYGSPSDRAAKPAVRMRPLQQTTVWGGFVAPHFGHLVAEYLTRLPQSLRDRPDDLYLFTVRPDVVDKTLPGYVWDLLTWYGLPRDQVMVVEEPCLAGKLWVAAQGEMLGAIPPCDEFLDLLETTADRNGLMPVQNAIVFVSRAGLLKEGRGGHAGEDYLASLLDSLGVKVIDPGQMSIRQQLEIYAGARVLVFAEGSALHGRCLLGRVAQKIHVLRRRWRKNVAFAQLGPRCARLTYHHVMAGSMGNASDARGNRADLEAAIYDPDLLFGVFAGIGIDLKPHWDTESYRAAAQEDLAAWMAKVPTSIDQMAENLAVLADLDLLPDQVTPPPVLQCQT
jgi:hypothetical protein